MTSNRTSADAALVDGGGGADTGDRTLDGPYPTWRALRWLFFFRLLMVIGLVLAFSPTATDPLTRDLDSQRIWATLSLYAILVLASGLGLSTRWPRRESQVALAVLVDILVFSLLMHLAGGIASGLGVLLAVAVAAGALMLEGRLSLLFAGLAALSVMTQQIYSIAQDAAQATSLAHAGLLGFLFFAVALLSHVLYRRVRSAEALAARRKVDIDDLSKLNDYIIQSIGTGILVADGERRLRLINQAAADLLAATKLNSGAALSDLSPELDAWLALQFQPGVPNSGLIRIDERKVRTSLRLLGDYRASGVIIYLRDNREVVAEAQQIKLASLGTLTASIAHNIRNPLSAVTHASQLLAEDSRLSNDDRELLEIIRRNSARIEETVQSVLQLSRRHQMEPCLIDLATWLKGFCTEFRERHGLNDTEFQIEFGADPIAVEADPRHLHQILANLCENALVHGRWEGQPAWVLVRFGRSRDSADKLVEITDQGPGVDAAIAGELFNPFYTTKAKGTGLGLYIARELAETNGIRLEYEPVEPRGSCFRLVFSG